MKLINLVGKGILFCLAFLAVAEVSASCIFSKAIEAQELEIGNMLSWSTIQEVNNEYFVVQKSTDGINYETVGQVKGGGNTLAEQNYRYLDISTGDLKSFYRIKQVDFDGAAGQSHTIVVNRTKANNFVVTSMSSTITDKLFTVTLRSQVEGIFDYKILNMGNEVLKTGKAEVINGANVISVDLEELSNGKMRFQLAVNDEVEELMIKKVDTDKVPKIDYVIKED